MNVCDYRSAKENTRLIFEIAEVLVAEGVFDDTEQGMGVVSLMPFGKNLSFHDRKYDTITFLRGYHQSIREYIGKEATLRVLKNIARNTAVK